MKAASVLRILLRAPEWNQQKLARKLGVSQSTVHRWMNGTEPEGGHRDALGELYADWLGHDKNDNLMRVAYAVDDTCELVSISKADQRWAPIPPVSKRLTEDYDLIAARIETSALWPRLYRYSIVYWKSLYKPEDMTDVVSVIALTDGRMMVGTIQSDPMNEGYTVTGSAAAEIVNVDIEWVAPFVWIHPDIPFLAEEISV